ASGGPMGHDLLRLAASVERGSEHPLGRAVVDRAVAEGLSLAEPQEFQAVRGKGVMATVDGVRALVGSRRMFEDEGMDISPLLPQVDKLEEAAKSVMLAATGTGGRWVPAGVIAVADTLKD